jgi:hypothetical protein
MTLVRGVLFGVGGLPLLSGFSVPLGCNPVLALGSDPAPFGLRLAGGTGGGLVMVLSFDCRPKPALLRARPAFENHQQGIWFRPARVPGSGRRTALIEVTARG